MFLLLKSFVLSSAMIWLMHPKTATWTIGTLYWPVFYPKVDTIWGLTNLRLAVSVYGKAIVRNPNRLGSYMHDAHMEVYLKLSDYSLRYFGTTETRLPARILGRSDTYLDTILTVDRIDFGLVRDLLWSLYQHSWRVPILAIGTAGVNTFTLLTVGIRCAAVVEWSPLACPYAQVTAESAEACQFTYNLQPGNGTSAMARVRHLPKKYLYTRLPRVPLLANIPYIDSVADWL